MQVIREHSQPGHRHRPFSNRKRPKERKDNVPSIPDVPGLIDQRNCNQKLDAEASPLVAERFMLAKSQFHS